MTKIVQILHRVDEAHYLKNHRAQRTRAVYGLLEDADSPIVHCTTGTPMMNRPKDGCLV